MGLDRGLFKNCHACCGNRPSFIVGDFPSHLRQRKFHHSAVSIRSRLRLSSQNLAGFEGKQKWKLRRKPSGQVNTLNCLEVALSLPVSYFYMKHIRGVEGATVAKFSRRQDPKLQKRLSRRNPDSSRNPAGSFARYVHRSLRANFRSSTIKHRRPPTFVVGTLGWRQAL